MTVRDNAEHVGAEDEIMIGTGLINAQEAVNSALLDSLQQSGGRPDRRR